MKNLITLAFVAGTFVACKSTAPIAVSVPQPPPVTLAPNVKNIAVINRTETVSNVDPANTTGKVFSPGCALESINGLADEFNKNKRFNDIKYLGNKPVGEPGSGRLPAPLSWDSVARLCRDHGAELLFVLETLDNSSKMTFTTHTVNVITSQGKMANTEHQASLQTTVKAGWRIYDPANKKVLDEFIVNTEDTFAGSGISKRAAEAAVTNRIDAVQEVGGKAGHEYATRVVTYPLKVTRQYYNTGNDNFKAAAVKVKAGDWAGAAAIWQKETGNKNKKLAAQAYYNLAIVQEVNGDIKAAIQQAQKSYDNASNPLAQNYIVLLQERKKAKRVIQPRPEEPTVSRE
ncbi:MAG: tetratricopeptide repeat protein [Bacteroidetes bacterium]|nr:tetratricopeptide repeat protein [Bacteroidota bacterium]